MSKASVRGSVAVQSFESTLLPIGIQRTPRLSPKDQFRLEAREQGLAEGYAEGLEIGRREGSEQALEEGRVAIAAEMTRIAQELESIGETVREAMDLWYRQAEESLATLAAVIAERLVAKELEVREEAILAITREALLEVTHATSARVRVNPFHSGVLENHRDALLSIAPSLKSIEVVADSAMLSGCVIETDGGAIDATIRTKLRSILGEAA